MSDAFALETELERRTAQHKDAQGFWHRYRAMKDYLETEYYPWVQANCPFFTDHGHLHVDSVLQATSLLLSKHLAPDGRSDLSALDLFLLLSGILWHDVGNVYGRSGHADRVSQMTQEIKKLGFPNPDIHRLVVEVSKAHAGREGLRIPRTEEDCATANQTYTVYPRALAAIVRFADEISENRSRISLPLLPAVPTDNQIFWEYANSITASRPDPLRNRVVVTVTLQADRATTKFACHDFPDRMDPAGRLSLLEYVLCRLEKMNNERAYCAPEFRRYASIREITGRLTIIRGTDRLENYELEVTFGDSGLHQSKYPNIEIFSEFFERYPHWKPAALQEALG